MFGIPNFDLLSDAGKQQFVEYVVNLARKEVLSYAPNFFATLGSGPGIASLPSNIVYQNTSYLDFNTDPAGAGPSGIGQLAWNDTNGTLEFILKGGNVALDIGQENVALVKHADNTGLTKGKVVYVAGSDGTNKTVRYAQANSEATSSKTFGVMAEDATGGSKGFVCTQGIVSNLNTLALTEGAAVYVSPTTAGDLTSTKPSAPNHMVLVGFCVRSHASLGVLYISVVNGFELQELHNVSINVGTLANGDIIKYNSSTQVWENVAADDIPAHASTHGSAGSDPITIAPSQVTGTAVINSDSRLTDTRTPTDASVTSPKFNIDYAAAPTVTEPGALYYNTSSSKLFVWDGAAWDEVGGGSGVPIGTIIWTGQGTIPSGFLDCDGSSQLRSAYPDLFAAISTTYGQGSNPGTTFALPNVSSTTGNYAICAQVSPATITSESLIAVPIGTLQLYAGSVYPTGWLRADGSAISRTTYADLFSIIGTTYGSGDGSTTFNLPNLLSSGTGSPVYIIKVLLSGSIQPSTVAHAASHVRGGSDIIDGDRAQIDYVPTNYTRNSGATGAGATTDLTAHLSGIDNGAFFKISGASSGEANTININTRPWNMPWGNVFKRVSSGSNLVVAVNTITVFPSLTGSVVLRNDRVYQLIATVNMYGPGGATNCTLYFAVNGSIIQNAEFTPRSAIGNSCTFGRYYTPGTTSTYTMDVRGVFTGGGGAYLNDGGREGYFMINDIGPA